ncbi:DEAD/DEAH box helicase [Virgibacillus salexigens]|uniref:ComF operon protein 1 n=1 Tax=Virgibacillus kapii TaxID=1638645 RepID=A0ABQ2DP22_9BACI|nr:DEAD/DEAH box helicase [Virgibacillus kapii]GGJ60569.1 ComF operon protein 1 [Virgibacillus kapii]
MEHVKLYCSGKLLLRNEIPLQESQFQTYLSQNLILPVPSIVIKNMFIRICQRCGNQRKSLFAKTVYYDNYTVDYYCRKCIEMGKVTESKPLYRWNGKQPIWKKHKAACTWEGKLTSAQTVAANEVVQAVQNQKQLLIWVVCGAGKTEMLFHGIEEALRLGKRICIATPRADVVRELVPRMQTAFSSIDIQGLYGESKDKTGTSQIIISTTHQLIRFDQAFDVMIIDELDAFPFHADPSLPYVAKRATKLKSTTIYLTATPRRKQQFELTAKRLPHIFVAKRFHGYPLPVPSLKMCFPLRKDLSKNNLPRAFSQWLQKRERKERQLLIFLPTIELTERLVPKITGLCKCYRMISSHEQIAAVHASDQDRESKVNHFRNGKVKVLLTTTILERGVTFPSVDVVVIDAGHHVFDKAALVQIAGRAGRSASDPTGEVVFFHDGKTKAMNAAIQLIKTMNKRGGF